MFGGMKVSYKKLLDFVNLMESIENKVVKPLNNGVSVQLRTKINNGTGYLSCESKVEFS